MSALSPPREDDYTSLLRLWDQSLERYRQDWGPRFRAYYPLRADSPSFCLSLFTGSELKEADVLAFARAFARDRPEVRNPYLTLPPTATERDVECLTQLGYRHSESDFACFASELFEPLPSDTPFRIAIGPYDDDAVFASHVEMTRAIFELANPSIPEFNREFNLQMGVPNRILNFWFDDLPVGTAAFSVIDGIAWLFGGSVYPDMRQKGVWRQMIRARQDASRELGAHTWFMQTRHPFLAAQFERTLEFRSFRLSS